MLVSSFEEQLPCVACLSQNYLDVVSSTVNLTGSEVSLRMRRILQILQERKKKDEFIVSMFTSRCSDGLTKIQTYEIYENSCQIDLCVLKVRHKFDRISNICKCNE